MRGRRKITDLVGTARTDMQETFVSMLKTAQQVRTLLGEKGYMLDEYLIAQINIAIEALRSDASEMGYNAGGSVFGKCTEERASMEQGGLFPRLHEYIQNNPLPQQSSHIRKSLYYAIFSGFSSSSTCNEHCRAVAETCETINQERQADKLYSDMCAILGDDDLLAQMDDLFWRRFYFTPYTASFQQGEALYLAYVLDSKESENGKANIQKLLDGILPFEYI